MKVKATYRDIENIDKIPTEKRDELRRLVQDMDNLLTEGGIRGGMIHGFFYDCVDGQIIRSLMPRKSKERYVNGITDFYIDDRVGFRGIKRVYELRGQLENFFRGVAKYRPRRFAVGDTVRIKNPPGGNAWLRDHPELWGKTAKVMKIKERSLSNLDYEGMEIQFGGKGAWGYVGSDSVTKVIKKRG